MHVLVIQYGGDYRQAVQRFSSGGDETYGLQKYSVNTVANLKNIAAKVSVLCYLSSGSYQQELCNGVNAIGMGFKDFKQVDNQKVVEAIALQKPHKLIIRTPQLKIFEWAIRNQVETLPLLADSFQNRHFKDRIKHYRLARCLNHHHFEWVANHNVNSCLSLQEIGVHTQKILPWDWPANKHPSEVPPKQIDSSRDAFKVFYAGKLSELKGVGDLIQATVLLKNKGINIRLQLAGGGEIEDFKTQAKNLKIEDVVDFLGVVSTNYVASAMREADVVVVPSRREYPEGFPKTVNESFCARTPLVASDHPVFQSRLKHRVNAMIFQSGNANELAARIEELLNEPKLYHQLSDATLAAWESLQIPLKWGDLVRDWVAEAPNLREKLARFSLHSKQYSLP